MKGTKSIKLFRIISNYHSFHSGTHPFAKHPMGPYWKMAFCFYLRASYLLLHLCTFVHIIKSNKLPMGSQQGKVKLKKSDVSFAVAANVFEDEKPIAISRDFLSQILLLVYIFSDIVIHIGRR